MRELIAEVALAIEMVPMRTMSVSPYTASTSRRRAMAAEAFAEPDRSTAEESLVIELRVVMKKFAAVTSVVPDLVAPPFDCCRPRRSRRLGEAAG